MVNKKQRSELTPADASVELPKPSEWGLDIETVLEGRIRATVAIRVGDSVVGTLTLKRREVDDLKERLRSPRGLLAAVFELRTAQKRYFKSRSRDDLTVAKAAEKAMDKVLALTQPKPENKRDAR